VGTLHEFDECPDATHSRQDATMEGAHRYLPKHRNRKNEPANKPKPVLTESQKAYLINLLTNNLEVCKGQNGTGGRCTSCKIQQLYIDEKDYKPHEARKKAITYQLQEIVKDSQGVTPLNYLRRMPTDLRRHMEAVISSHLNHMDFRNGLVGSESLR